MTFLKALESMANATLHFDEEAGGTFLDGTALVAEAPRDTHLYCCGPAPMLAAFESATANWPREQIHVEYFTSKAEPAKTGDFTVELVRSKQEFFIANGKTILEVLLDAGVNVAYSCDAGICGAC
jgi:ferredoxin-NADP reductase